MLDYRIIFTVTQSKKKLHAASHYTYGGGGWEN